MVCTPWGPRAVPTGGAGVALPAGSWIFTMAATRRLAMTYEPLLESGSPTRIVAALELGDLRELELDGRLPAEDVDEHLELHLVLVDLGDGAGEVGERTLLDPHRLARLVVEPRPGLLRALAALDL